ncbi:Zinc finger, GATA-type [Sesbania bispinosa]|nr:Zinc finger, GATA-type [Sesbania bispinosa]
MDEIDCGSFFDHIDDLLDFPVEDVDGGGASLPSVAATGNCNSLASIWPPESESFPGSDSVFPATALRTSPPSFQFRGGSLTMKKVEEQPSCATKEESVHTQFQTSSPVSVLESSSSCSGGKTASEIYIPVPCGRARSKRPRPATFNPRPAMHLISPASSFVGENIQPNVISTKASSDSENFAESQPVTKKCMHCEITKTPQWRAGPMGPKTLCNACGVRYKSGRLFPEYRPAASPTFCPSLHSNSHKKVLEMRCKGVENSGFEHIQLPHLNSFPILTAALPWNTWLDWVE